MSEEEIDFVIIRALRDDFDNAHKDRQMEIYEVCKSRKYEEAADEMRQDLNSDYNLNLR